MGLTLTGLAGLGFLGLGALALPSGNAAQGQGSPATPLEVQAAPPGAISAPPPGTCRATSVEAEAECLNRCLADEIHAIFYRRAGITCAVPCGIALASHPRKES